mmetsp:Transcript_32823/g.75045  ORF Transcript_32823/g.75045 Transcript_32823/m.75045 type:complete len:165 (+) Transcript_32823:21-515(+)
MRKDKVLELAKGFRGRGKNCPKIAARKVDKALQYAYRDRRVKKREWRSLWIVRVNAATREHGMLYGQLVHGLNLANVILDRKSLADIAVNEPQSFADIVSRARMAIEEKYSWTLAEKANLEKMKAADELKRQEDEKLAAERAVLMAQKPLGRRGRLWMEEHGFA